MTTASTLVKMVLVAGSLLAAFGLPSPQIRPIVGKSIFPCYWPTPDPLSKINPNFLVRYRGGQQMFNISSNDQIQSMVTILQNGKIVRDRVLFVVHGFKHNIDTPWLSQTADALLAVENSTVIVIGWGNGADYWVDYDLAASNTQTVAAAVALAAQLLKAKAPVYTYCIGHSLGAHICGMAGTKFTFDRISGLDPAGPGFDDCPHNIGLTSVSADCVDVLHTNGESYTGFGTLSPLGHVDFYANCGQRQPSCSLPSDVFGCSHGKAIDYFMQSIISFDVEQPPAAFPSSQGPCDDTFLSSCEPCTSTKKCPLFQKQCKTVPTVPPSIGYGSVCRSKKAPAMGTEMWKTYFGAMFVPATPQGLVFL